MSSISSSLGVPGGFSILSGISPSAGANSSTGFSPSTGTSLPAGTSPADAAALIGAEMQLEIVQSVIGAMHAADIASGKQFGAMGIIMDQPTPPGPAGPPQGGQACQAGPVGQCRCDRYCPSQPVIKPPVRYLPQPVVHTHCQSCDDAPPPPRCDTAKFPLPPPPWKLRVWQQLPPLPAPQTIKVVLHKTDIIHKGSLLDLFV